MTYTFDDAIVSDLHKDARGFRPGRGWWEYWNVATNDAKQQIWDSLCKEFTEEQAREASGYEEAEAAFDRLLDKAEQLGAADRETAVRWLLEAEQFDDFDLQYGADYVAYHFGMSYSNKHKDVIEKAVRDMSKELDSGVQSAL